MIYPLFLAATGLTLSMWVGLVALRVGTRRRELAEAARPDYQKIAELEKQLGIHPLPHSHRAGVDPQTLHLTLDSLWRQAQTDDSPGLRQRIAELSEQYVQVLNDQEKETE